MQKHLLNQNITTGLYTLKWFFQCFLDRLPFSVSVRVWDLYLLEGESIMFATAYTILRYTIWYTILRYTVVLSSYFLHSKYLA